MSADGNALGRIKVTHGKWILVSYDEEASLAFNGLPSRARDKSDDGVAQIIIPESAIEKGMDVREWERVYKVEQIGPLVENSPVKVGEYIIAKGHAQKLFTKPVLYAIFVENIVCTLDSAQVTPKSILAI